MAEVGGIYHQGVFNKPARLLGKCFPWYVVVICFHVRVRVHIYYLETDACAVPVLTPKEAGKMTSNIPIFHPQVSKPKQPKAGQYLDPKSSIVIQPGLHTDAVLQDFGFDAGQIKQLRDEGVLGKYLRRVTFKL